MTLRRTSRHFVQALPLALIFCAPPAHAFRCTQVSGLNATENGPSLSWPHRTLTYTLHPAGSRYLDTEATLQVLRQAFAVWQGQTLSADAQSLCGAQQAASDIHFIEAPGDVAYDWVGFNFLAPATNKNLLVFRDDSWPPQDPGSTDVIALSTITYSALTGEILDADIEFNSANFNFSVSDPNNEQMDLLGTAVHEIGHFLGLAHCQEGIPCGHNEVMESTANYGETTKRLLRCDDRTAIAFKYPLNGANGYAVGTLASASTNLGLGTCVPPQVALQTPQVHQLSRAQGRGCSQSGVALPLGGVWAIWRLASRRRRGLCTKVRLRLWVMWVLALGVGVGCGDINACGGRTGTIDPNGPLITSMQLVGQVDVDPWRAVLKAHVLDADGDLGQGTVDYYVNGSPTSAQTQQMSRVYDASGGLPEDAQEATLQLLLRFSQNTAANAYLHLGTQVTDAAGHKSNCYRLDLSYLLTALNNAVLSTP